MVEEYEMLSHKKLKSLQESMDKLGKNLNDMIDMFSSAATSMHVEEKEEKALEPVMKKLNTLIDQNEKIASGILAVADMFREEIPKIHEELRRLETLTRPMPRLRPELRPKPEQPMPQRVIPRQPVPPLHTAPRERPPMPPGLSEFEKPMRNLKENKKKPMFSGLFSK